MSPAVAFSTDWSHCSRPILFHVININPILLFNGEDNELGVGVTEIRWSLMNNGCTWLQTVMGMQFAMRLSDKRLDL